MSKNIKLNTQGIIINGEDKGWYIYIEEDLKNTGGYYIFIEKTLEKDSEGYDEWVENMDCLKNYFVESQWEVKWLD
ncbi:MAG: hypothetical protein BGO14_00785 [Chlamydiales bacterium 38-26]|nr:hypothetical protein [Chlamydiales bacterium]OJV07258.1 MAG: hypothetical protein BGO14_00785 [Chlamydiales bacterium 38-26]